MGKRAVSEHPRFHAVKFYDSDDALCPLVAEFLAQGVITGQPALVIATPEHRAGIVRELKARHLDVGSMETAGDLLNTLEYNLTAPAEAQLPVRAVIGNLDPKTLPLFRTQLGKRADALLELVDLFLESHRPESRRGGESIAGVEVGAAVIAIRRNGPNQDEFRSATRAKSPKK